MEEKHYKPLKIIDYEVVGFHWAMKAMRLPKGSTGDTIEYDCDYADIGPKDLHLAKNLVKAGDDHAKALRGVIVYVEMQLQVGWMIEFETYRHGVECLSTSSSMHCELSGLHGDELAEQKQADLSGKQYARIVHISYQALRNMYHARRNHRHPDWQIFCDWIEGLPYAAELICCKRGSV